MSDRLQKMFMLQRGVMDLLREYDKFPEYPVDLTTKQGQRLAKEVIWNMVEEIAESSFTMKNRQHKLSDDTAFDRAHYLEEICDAWAYMMELLLLSGFSEDDLYQEYSRKNFVVRKRIEDGY